MPPENSAQFQSHPRRMQLAPACPAMSSGFATSTRPSPAASPLLFPLLHATSQLSPRPPDRATGALLPSNVAMAAAVPLLKFGHHSPPPPPLWVSTSSPWSSTSIPIIPVSPRPSEHPHRLEPLPSASPSCRTPSHPRRLHCPPPVEPLAGAPARPVAHPRSLPECCRPPEPELPATASGRRRGGGRRKGGRREKVVWGPAVGD
jgi:hypothetical protein